MIIGISGKIGSGKDTVGKIIQYFTSGLDKGNVAYDVWDGNTLWNSKPHDWQIRKFADALKNIVCILIGCTREQLEDIDFKNSKLGEEWIRYGYADGFIKKYIGNGEMGEPIMNNKQCSKEEYEGHYKTNWQTAYKSHLTVRELLQVIGTDLFRNQLHEDTWVNALMSEYKPLVYSRTKRDYLQINSKQEDVGAAFNDGSEYPNWIITDVRFPNELQAIKDKGGIIIRVIKDEPCEVCGLTLAERRGNICKEISCPLGRKQHESETALDNATFDYTISAKQGDIESLIQQTKEILIKEKLLCLNENKN